MMNQKLESRNQKPKAKGQNFLPFFQGEMLKAKTRDLRLSPAAPYPQAGQ
jgi:hypothetical protein